VRKLKEEVRNRRHRKELSYVVLFFRVLMKIEMVSEERATPFSGVIGCTTFSFKNSKQLRTKCALCC